MFKNIAHFLGQKIGHFWSWGGEGVTMLLSRFYSYLRICRSPQPSSKKAAFYRLVQNDEQVSETDRNQFSYFYFFEIYNHSKIKFFINLAKKKSALSCNGFLTVFIVRCFVFGHCLNSTLELRPNPSSNGMLGQGWVSTVQPVVMLYAGSRVEARISLILGTRHPGSQIWTNNAPVQEELSVKLKNLSMYRELMKSLV